MSTRKIIMAAAGLGTDVVSNEWVATLVDETNNRYAEVEGVTVDQFGNVYAAGYCNNTQQLLVTKYSSTGQLQWQQGLSKESTSGWAKSIVIDHDNNLCVLGSISVNGSAVAYVAKLTSAGSIVWQKSIDNFDVSSADAGQIAVDGLNNLYISGDSYKGAQGDNFYGLFVVKLDTNGTIVWQTNLGDSTGGVNSSTNNVGIAVSATGNSYITGSDGNWSPGNIYTAKHDAAGVLQWQRKLELQGSGASHIAIDSSENVYVAIEDYYGLAVSYVVKYDSNGNLLWQQKLSLLPLEFYAIGVAVDNLDNLFIVAEYDYIAYQALLKIDTVTGAIIWQRVLTNPQTDGISTAGVFAQGPSIYSIATYEWPSKCVITRLPSDGTGVGTYGPFVYAITPSDVLVDQPGTLISETISLADAVPTLNPVLYRNTVPASDSNWLLTLDTGFEGASGHAIETDWSGTMFVAAQAANADSNTVANILRINPFGAVDWQKILYKSNSQTSTFDLAYDGSNVYLVGGVGYPIDQPYIAKYNSNSGGLYWEKEISGGSGNHTGVAIDYWSNNLYAAGYQYNSELAQLEASIIKSDLSTGSVTWQKKFGDPVATNTYFTSIAFDNDALYSAAVSSAGGMLNDHTIGVIVKTDTNGDILWQKTLTTVGYNHYINSISVFNGDVYVCGFIRETTTQPVFYRGFVAKYNSLGELQWERLLSDNYNLFAYQLKADSCGVYVCGSFDKDSYSGSMNGFVCCYNFDGQLQWQRQLTSSSSTEIYAIDTHGIEDGEICITGGAYDNNTSIIVARFGIDGDGSSVGTYGPYEYAPSILVDEAGIATSSDGTLTVTADTKISIDGVLTEGDGNLIPANFSAYNSVAWVNTLNDLVPFNTSAYNVAADSAGNIYAHVAYFRSQSGEPTSCGLIKYSPLGTVMWQRSYTVTDPNAYPFPSALVVSDDGYSFAASNATGDGVYNIICYNPDGYIVWQKTFELSVTNFGSLAALDSSKNLYVLTNNSTTLGLTLLKFDQSGTLLWQRDISLPGAVQLYDGAIDVDSSGNIFVSAYDFGAWPEQLGLIIKLDSTGQIIWQKTTNGTEIRIDTLAVSPLDNIFVMGGVYAGASFLMSLDKNTGEIQWQRQLANPNITIDSGNLVTDSSGNCYIIGNYVSGVDYVCIFKFDYYGNLIWQRELKAKDTFLIAYGMTVDSTSISFSMDSVSMDSGNFVTVAKFPTDGTGIGNYGAYTYSVSNIGFIEPSYSLSTATAAVAPGTLVEVTPAVVEENIKSNSVTYRKDDPASWVSYFYKSVEGANSYSNKIAVDSQGNTYVVGDFGINAVSSMLGIIKYDSNGNLLWQKMTNSTGGLAIEIDSQDNVYVLEAYNSNSILYKFDTNGIVLWQKQFSSAYTVYLEALAIDAGDNICLAGWAQTTPSNLYTSIIKCDSDGNVLWQRLYGDGIGWPVTHGVDTDSAGNIYALVGGNGAYVVKFDSSGTVVWQFELVDSDPTGYFEPTSISVDSNRNNIFVAGVFSSSASPNNIAFVVKISSAGSLVWSERFTGPGDCYAYDIYADQYFSVYLVGAASDPTLGPGSYYGDNQIWVTRLRQSNGESNWQRWFVDSTHISDGDSGRGVYIDAVDNFYITGSCANANDPSGTSVGVVAKLPITGDGVGIYGQLAYEEAPVTSTSNFTTSLSAITLPDVAGTVLDATSTNTFETGTQTIVTAKPEVPGAWMVEFGEPDSYTVGNDAQSAGVAVDVEGNIYTASNHRWDSRKVYVTKYSPSGALQWQTALTNINQSFWAMCIAVDDNKYQLGSELDVYVGGSSQAGAVIVKLNPAGQVVWQKRLHYNSLYARINKIAVDTNNTIWVTGTYDIITSAPRCFIAAYSDAGDLLVSKQIGSGFGAGYSIATDTENNVCVVGDGFTAGATEATAMILKYEAGTNTLLWQKTFKQSTYLSRALDVDTDQTNNIYVALFQYINGVSGYPYLAKYNSAGTLQWQYSIDIVADWPMPMQVTVDKADNVYLLIQGSGFGFICKFNSAGTMVWKQTLTLTNEYMGIDSLAVDNQGSLYAYGYDYDSGNARPVCNLVKLPTNGTGTGTYGYLNCQPSTIPFSTGLSTSVTSDLSSATIPLVNVNGTVSLTSSVSSSKLFDKGTVTSWISELNFANYKSIAVDSQSRIVAVADARITQTPSSKYGIIIAQYQPNGEMLWQYSLDGPYFANVNGVAVDSLNDIYVVGTNHLTDGSDNIVLVKLDAWGNVQWKREVSTSNSSNGNAIFIDDNDLITITGNDSNAIAIVTYDVAGSLIGQQRIDGSEFGQGNGVAARAGVTYVSGHHYSYSLGGMNAFLVKVDLGGITERGLTRTNGYQIDGYQIEQTALVLDSNDNQYILGYYQDTYTKENLFLAKFDQNSVLEWQKVLATNDDNSGRVNGYKLALDDDDNIYIVGKTSIVVGGVFVEKVGLVVKYSPDGGLIWQRMLQSTQLRNLSVISPVVVANAITCDNQAIYVAGYIDNWNMDNGFVLRLPADGTGLGSYGPMVYKESFLIEVDSPLVASTHSLAQVTSAMIPTISGIVYDESNATRIVYQQNQTAAWVNALSPPQVISNTNDFSNYTYGIDDLVFDKVGNITSVGFRLGNMEPQNLPGDSWITKHDTGGNLLWQKKISDWNEIDNMFAHAVGTDGYNTYVFGDKNGNPFGMQFGSDGYRGWQNFYSELGYMYFSHVVVDRANSTVIVLGSLSQGPAVVLALSTATGSIYWQKKIDIGTWPDVGLLGGLEVDQSTGDIYLVGSGINTASIVTIKLDSNGTIQWQREIIAPSGAMVTGNDITITRTGDVIVVGSILGGTSPLGAFLARYLSDGTIVAQYRINKLGTTDVAIDAKSIVADEFNNIFICGEIRDTWPWPGLVIKYSYDMWPGTPSFEWARTFAGPNSPGSCSSIAIDHMGNFAFVAGTSDGNYEYNTISKFPIDGTETGAYGNFVYADYPGIVITEINWAESASSFTSGIAEVLDEPGNANIVEGELTSVVYTKDQSQSWISFANTSTESGWGDGIIVDSLGNTYSVRISDNDLLNQYYDSVHCYLTKTNSHGTVLWQRDMFNVQYRYSGISMTLDQENNIYVVAQISYSYPTQTPRLFVFKFDNQGTLLWQKQSISPDSWVWYKPAIAVDPTDGILLIASNGYNDGLPKTTIKNQLLIAYDLDGNLQWQNKQFLSAFGSQTTSATIDIFQNAYVLAHRYNNTATAAFYTLSKFYLDGSIQWAIDLIPVTDSYTGYCEITNDIFGNVYVSMTYVKVDTYTYYPVLAKLDGNGNLLWVRKLEYSAGSAWGGYPGGGIVVDLNGNIYLTLQLYNNETSDTFAAIVKYDSDGVLLWQNQLTCDSFNMWSTAINADTQGNLYVTGGYSVGAEWVDNSWFAKLPTDGGTFGVYGSFCYKPSSLLVDSAGGVTISPTTLTVAPFTLTEEAGQMSIIYTNKPQTTYNSGDVNGWIANLIGNDDAYSVSIDSQGNVYAVGSYYDSVTGTYSVSLVKYGYYGTLEWKKILVGDINFDNIGISVTALYDGNVYVTGTDAGSLILVKLNSAGTQIWQRVIRATQEFEWVEGHGVSVDGSGNVFVTGTYINDVAGYSILVVKYSATGDLLWQRVLSGPSPTIGYSVASMYSDVYVAAIGSYNTNYSICLIKYNESGALQWQRNLYSSDAAISTQGYGVAADANGNAYLMGVATGSEYDAIIIAKYSVLGDLLWQRALMNVEYTAGRGDSIAIDSDDNVYVLGVTYSNKPDTLVIAKYNTNGVLQWQKALTQHDLLNIQATGITVDDYGTVYVTGFAKDNNWQDNILIAKFSGTGVDNSIFGDEAYLYNSSTLLNQIDILLASPGVVGESISTLIDSAGILSDQPGTLVATAETFTSAATTLVSTTYTKD